MNTFIYFLEYSCGNSISDDCQSEYDNAIRNGNLDYFYHRCATEGGSQPLRTRCSLCCNNNGNDKDYGVGIIRSCADQNDNIHDCKSDGTLAESCVCGTNLCNDVCCNSANKNHTFSKLTVLGLVILSKFIINI